MELVGLDHRTKDDAAAGALHSGFLVGAHHGDWADRNIPGFWSDTDLHHVSFHCSGVMVREYLHFYTAFLHRNESLTSGYTFRQNQSFVG